MNSEIVRRIYIARNGGGNDALSVLYKDIDKKRGTDSIICTGEYKLKLNDNLYSVPIDYI